MNTTILSLLLIGAVGAEVEATTERETFLYVTTKPAGAEVLVDGKHVGTTPGLFPFQPGVRRQVIVELDGHEQHKETITIRAGDITRLSLKLLPGRKDIGRKTRKEVGGLIGRRTRDSLEATPRQLLRLEHDGHVLTVAFSPNGKILASGDDRGLVKLSDPANGVQIMNLRLLDLPEKGVQIAPRMQRDGVVEALAFSPDSTTLAIGGAGGRVQLFNAETGTRILTLHDVKLASEHEKTNPDKPDGVETRLATPRAHGSVMAMAFSPDGTMLATAGEHITEASGVTPGILKLWDAKTGELKRDLQGHLWQVSAVAFSPEGKFLASAGQETDSTSGVRLWDARTGNLKSKLSSPHGDPCSLAFSPDGKLLAVGTTIQDEDIPRGSLIIYRVETGATEVIRQLPKSLWSMAFSSGGDALATTGFAETVSLWDPLTGELKHEIRPTDRPAEDARLCVAFFPLANMLAIGGKDADENGFVTTWEITRPSETSAASQQVEDQQPLPEDATFDAILARLTNPPKGWKVTERQTNSIDDLADNVDKSRSLCDYASLIGLSGHDKRILVGVYRVAPGKDLREAREAVLRSTLKLAPPSRVFSPACLTYGSTILTFLGSDISSRDEAIRELGFQERSQVPLWADITKQFELRKQNHVQLVVGKERLTLEGEPTTWEELRNRLEKLPDRENTVLYIARTADDWIIAEWKELEDRILVTCRDVGIESTSFVGRRPLGYRATRSLRLMIAGKEYVTLDGRELKHRDLFDELLNVSDRYRTVLEICRAAGASETMKIHEWENLHSSASAIANRLGFKSTTYIGEYPLGSRASIALSGRYVGEPIPAQDVKLDFAKLENGGSSFHANRRPYFPSSWTRRLTVPIRTADWAVGWRSVGGGDRSLACGYPDRARRDGPGPATSPASSPFRKTVSIPVGFGEKELLCPVAIELDRDPGGNITGHYWFCSYLRGSLPSAVGERCFEIVNLDRQMRFRDVASGDEPDAVLGVDVNGDGTIDPSPDGKETFGLCEPFPVRSPNSKSRYYVLAEVNPYEPRVAFREVAPPGDEAQLQNDLADQRRGQATFGPAVERILVPETPDLGAFLNLESGKTFQPPQDILEDRSGKELIDWAKENKIHVNIRLKPGPICYLSAIDSYLYRSHDTSWQSTTANDVLTDRGLRDGEFGYGNITKRPDELPATYMFKARGCCGLLEIVAISESGIGVKFKLVRIPDASSAVEMESDQTGLQESTQPATQSTQAPPSGRRSAKEPTPSQVDQPTDSAAVETPLGRTGSQESTPTAKQPTETVQSPLGYSDEEKKELTEKDVAVRYFEVFTGGDIGKANELSTVPYSFDGKEILTKKEQVEEKHKSIIAGKGERKVPKHTITIPNNPEKLDLTVFPKYVVYRVNIEDEDEHVDIYVKTGTDPKVIGFRDLGHGY